MITINGVTHTAQYEMREKFHFNQLPELQNDAFSAI